MNKLVIGLLLYVLAVIVTFGNAAVYFEKAGKEEYKECMTIYKDDPICTWKKAGGGFKAIVSSIGWPLYLSYRIAENEQ
jgi:hypothetical protein